MIANFYLLAESFAKNEIFSNEQIESKIKELAKDVKLIRQYKDKNFFYCNVDELYPTKFYEEYSFLEFICNSSELKSKGVDRDVINALIQIIEFSSTTFITSQEVKTEILSWVDDKNIFGFLCFHKIDDIEESIQIIYGISNWYKFRRHYLSLYPRNGEYFIDECSIYFPNLYFREGNKRTVSFLLKDSPIKLIHYLAELNDKFQFAKTIPYDRKRTLERLNTLCSFDQDASDEGNSGSKKKSKIKKRDSFIFKNDAGESFEICCDLHLKILKDDKGKISTDRRIYFCENANVLISTNKILIGHIGCHLH